MPVRFSRRARQDILAIWLRVARDSISRADRINMRIEVACQQLATFPEIGRMRSDIALDMRAIVIDRWLAIYRIDSDGAFIIRVVDGARDISNLNLSDD